MKNNDIKISVIVSTYNWPEALEKCLLSLFRQTILPCEIIVADDGSKEPTKSLIDSLRKKSPVPLKHIWQEDCGFRVSMIRNKAFAEAIGDYFIQIDGDILCDKNFIKDHIEAIEDNSFVCGSRVHLDSDITKRFLANEVKKISLFNMKLGDYLNSLRIKPLRKYFAHRYGQKKVDHLRGCNMAFWKKDIIKVNGYNEDLTQWGHEDGELAYRLHFAGVKKIFIKFGAIAYHLYHKEASRSNESVHLRAIENVKNGKISFCKNGIDKYLK